MKNVMGILGFQLKTENVGSIEPSKVIISLSNDVSFKVKAFEILLITDCLVWPPLQSIFFSFCVKLQKNIPL